MAPVGSFESLTAAIQAGADSVYFGLEHLNMRSKSSLNFTTSDLGLITKTCREKGVKTYLTVNTVMFDNDLPLMRKLVDAAKENQVSALIASDQSVIEYGRFVGMEIHLSTQINISNYSLIMIFANIALVNGKYVVIQTCKSTIYLQPIATSLIISHKINISFKRRSA